MKTSFKTHISRLGSFIKFWAQVYMGEYMYTVQGIYIYQYQQVNKVEYMYNVHGIYLPPGLQGVVHEHCTGYIPTTRFTRGSTSTQYRVYTYNQVYKGELHCKGYIPTTRFTRGSSTCNCTWYIPTTRFTRGSTCTLYRV